MQRQATVKAVARGLIPVAAMLLSFVLALLAEPLSVFAALIGLSAFALLTPGVIVASKDLTTCITAASAAGALTIAAMFAGAWLSLPIFWFSFAMASVAAFADRLLTRMGVGSTALSFVAPLVGIVLGFGIWWFTYLSGTVPLGCLVVAVLSGLLYMRVRLGAVEESPAADQ